jgi:PAS domain S-box-containing protein
VANRREESRALLAPPAGARLRGDVEPLAARWVSRMVTALVALFALAATVATILGILGIDTLSTLRAYAAAQSRWSREEAESLLALVRQLESADEKDRQLFLAAQEIPKAIHRALHELDRPVIEPGPAAEALLAARSHPDEVDGMVSVFARLRNLDDVGRGLAVWHQADALGEEIAALGEKIREDVASRRLDMARRSTYQREIEQIGARLSEASERLTAQVGVTTRRLRRLLVATLVVLTLLATAFAVAVSARVARLLRKRERDLAVSERRYRLLFERNLAGLYRATLDGRILECNSALARTLGHPTPEDVLQLNMHELYLDPEDREVTIATLLQQKFLVNYEIGLRRRDGSPVWVLVNESLLEDESGGPVL